jgi:uncharacterized protein DUF6582
MAELTTKSRNSLADSVFGLPKQRKYPTNDVPHARNALARASQQFNAGRLSASHKAQIDAKANAKLKGK